MAKQPKGYLPVTLDLDKAWKLYDKQCQFVNDNHTFNMMLGGVGSGKTHALSAWVIRRAFANPNATGAVLGRTGIDLTSVLIQAVFDRLQECQDQCGVNLIRDYDKGQALLTLCNGAKIWFRPYNRISKLRGITLSWAAIDEIEFSEAEPDEVWSVVTGRLRGKGKLPGIAIATSPNGARGTTLRFMQAQRQYLSACLSGDTAAMRTFGQYHMVRATSYHNPFLPDHFFDSLKSMSKRRYEQEVNGAVLLATNTVFQLESRHMVKWRWQDHPDLPRVYGIDWGGGAHHAAIMCQVEPSGRWVVADEMILDDAPRATFQDKLQKWILSHGKNPHLMAADRAAPIEIQQLQAFFRGVPVRWMESKEEQGVIRGLEIMRDMLDPLSEVPRLVFADHLNQILIGQTATILPAMRGYSYEMGRDGQPSNRPKKDNVNDHIMDALRYIISAGFYDKTLHAASIPMAPQPAAGWKHPKAQLVGRSSSHT